jgi:hypothetical protein
MVILSVAVNDAFHVPVFQKTTSLDKHLLSNKLSIKIRMSGELPVIEPLFKGLNDDIKRKSPYFLSEFKDGFKTKVLSASFFLFFACLAPAIAFGSLLTLVTGGMMGTIEAVGATALGGLLYALFSGQPLTIIGTTGPLLAFVKVLYSACLKHNLPFLPVYSWVGMWSSLLLFISSITSTSNVVSYFTRFTDDIFSMLISMIFIIEAIRELFGYFMNPAITGLSACLSIISAFVTLFSITTLSSLRKSQFFHRNIREIIADFAPTLGVIFGIFVSKLLSSRYACPLDTLRVPEVLATTTGRPWLVDIFSIPMNIRLLCFLPAVMAYVLLFMDQNITVHLVMSKENKLKKGSGLHLDMLVISAVTALTSLFGMPWMVAATVRSLAHVRSLRVYETTDENETNEPQFKMVGVLEQRVSGLLIHGLITAALIFKRDLLRLIPVSVITGLFLFLGTSSIESTDLFERTKLFISDERDIKKNTSWYSKMSLGRVKLFTSIQLALLSGMWWIKGTKFGVLFPVLIGALAPVRVAIEKFNIFSKAELDSIDEQI